MRLYRLIVFILSPVIAARLLARLVVGKETRAGLAERLALGSAPAGARHTVWLHGASLGEIASARLLLQHLLDQNEHLHIIATCNTTTARDMMVGWNTPRLHARLAPLDSVAVLRRFTRTWTPRAAFTLENEIWPNRIFCCARADIPFIVLGGRMSAGSAEKWRKFPNLARQVMGAVTALAPLNDENGERFLKLGLPAANISHPVNLKSGVEPAPLDPAELKILAGSFARKTTVLAASTHAGEEEVILAAFAAAQQKNPALRLIIAPRHPDRGADVARLISRYGLGFDQRSTGDEIDINKAVYLADSIGELPLWLSLSAITILGGSFQPLGGHTPVEPVQFGSVVIHGPDISNHSDIYTALHKNDAAFCASDTAELAALINNLTDIDTGAIAARSTQALATLLPDNPDPATLLNQLDKASGGKLTRALLG